MNDELILLGALTLPGTESAARRVRGFARGTLGADHPLLPDIELCLTEKFTNALRHTASGRGGRVGVVLLASGDGCVRSEVADDGAAGARPRLPPAAADLAEHGRGLCLLAALATRWGYREDGPRTVVWAEYRLPGNGAAGRPPTGRPAAPADQPTGIL